MLETKSRDVNKAIAVSGDRRAARHALTPVILSIARLGEIEGHSDDHLRLTVKRGPFEIRFVTYDAQTLRFRIQWNGELVMTGVITPNGFRPLTGELEIVTWKRGHEVSAWQAELFDAFPLESYPRTVPLSAKYAFLQMVTSR